MRQGQKEKRKKSARRKKTRKTEEFCDVRERCNHQKRTVVVFVLHEVAKQRYRLHTHTHTYTNRGEATTRANEAKGKGVSSLT